MFARILTNVLVIGGVFVLMLGIKKLLGLDRKKYLLGSLWAAVTIPVINIFSPFKNHFLPSFIVLTLWGLAGSFFLIQGLPAGRGRKIAGFLLYTLLVVLGFTVLTLLLAIFAAGLYKFIGLFR